MCQHRSRSRWTHAWDIWLLSFLGIEVSALIIRGEDATLTAYMRRAIGDHPRCKHRNLGRGILFGFICWMAAHLVFGVLPKENWLDRYGR